MSAIAWKGDDGLRIEAVMTWWKFAGCGMKPVGIPVPSAGDNCLIAAACKMAAFKEVQLSVRSPNSVKWRFLEVQGSDHGISAE